MMVVVARGSIFDHLEIGVARAEQGCWQARQRPEAAAQHAQEWTHLLWRRGTRRGAALQERVLTLPIARDGLRAR